MSLRCAVTAKRLSLVASAVVLLALTATPAHAAFPGQNGQIVYYHVDGGGGSADGLHTVNADGSIPVFLADGYVGSWSPDGAEVAYTGPFEGVRAIKGDGTGQRLVTDPASPSFASWSPDGSQVLYQDTLCDATFGCYTDIWKANSDGSGGDTRLTNATYREFNTGPVWSPNGERIAFGFVGPCCELKTMNPQGSSVTTIVSNASNPSWSPDGGKLAFDRGGDIWIVNADGTGAIQLTTHVARDSDPAWSPDGKKIAFTSFRDEPNPSTCQGAQCNLEIYVMNTDGTGQTNITNSPGNDQSPDWQPILRGYPRPAAAATFRVPLAIAYQQCSPDADNRTHGPVLSAPSCNPAPPASDYLTVGTLDANGELPSSVGFARYQVCISGTTASGPCSAPTGMSAPDVKLEYSQTDVRCKLGLPAQSACQAAALSDYTGELEVTTTLRITDKQNSPAPPGGTSGTATDLPLSYTVPCSPTGDPADLGASCNLLTRINALIPGAAVPGKRAIWQLSQIEVRDGGSDGLVSTAGNTVFARQGIFIP